MNKRINKIAFISTLAAIFVVPLLGCNPTNKDSEINPTPQKFSSINNVVKITFDAGDGYIDDTYTIHSKQVEVHKGLTWKYIQNRIPKTAYFYNHTFNYWTIHGEKIEDTYQLNSDVTVNANYTAGNITTLQLDAGTEGTFTGGVTTWNVASFTANTTYGTLKEAGTIVEPTPTSSDRIFAGYKDPKGNYIEDVTKINFLQPTLEGAKYIFTATYVDKPKAWEEDSWDSLIAASNRGLAYLKTAYLDESETTFVGKEKDLTLNNGQTYTVRVIGEEEDITTNSTNAALTFEFENVLIPNQAFDNYSHNNNAYAGSSLDKALNNLLDNFPTSLKGNEGIRSVNKITNGGNKGGSASAATTPHKLFPLSATEMNITSVGEAMANANAYSYYSSSRTQADYVRTYYDPITQEEYNSDYWLRSPDYQSNIACNCMDSTGKVIGNPIDINIGKGVVPAFCIGTSSEKITVTFDIKSEGGIWKDGTQENATRKITSGGLLSSATSSLSTFSRDGYTFAGWYTYKDETTKELDKLYSDTDNIYTTVTLHAHFIADSSLAKVEFNGGTQYVSSGATRTLLNNDYVAKITPSSTNSYHQAPTTTRGIQVEVKNGDEYKEISDFSVDSTGTLTIPAKYVYGDIKITIKYGTIAYNMEETIARIAATDENGATPGEYARQYFSIGDILNVAVKEGDNDVNYRAMIIGMGHSTDTFDNGSKTSAFTFEFLDMPGDVEIAYSTADKPSYLDSLVKSTVDSYYEKISNSYLKGAIKNVTHTTTKDYSASSYDSFTSYMFTLSAAEHTSIEEAQAPELEGKQYEYYSTYNDHTKYRNGAATTYWLRTSYVSDSGYNRAYYVYSSGDYYNYTTYHKANYKGVAPAFCI